MLRYIDHTKMGRSRLGWLDSHFHFSFAEYDNPENVRFGVLRVINDDIVRPGTGFDTHPHRDMEIISYVVEGELSHADSMGNQRTLTRGQVQYMSAGTGVHHSEHNRGKDPLRFLQIWIYPDGRGYTPNYGDVAFRFADRIDRWLPIAAGTGNDAMDAPIRLHQDANVYATLITKGKAQSFHVGEDRQAYLVLIEGEAQVGDIHLHERDALEITAQDITMQAAEDAHVLLIEMAKEA